MKKLLLILLFIPLIGFGQEPGLKMIAEKQDIYFEGVVESETMYDGIFYITVKIRKGELAGESVDIYFQVSFEDVNRVECKDDVKIDGSGAGEGKNIKGKIIHSIGEFENYETGETDIKKIYRPIELNNI